MPNPRLAARYAKALLDISLEKGELETTYSDMLWLQKVCASNKDFVNLLRSPIIKADTKKKIVDAVTEKNISTITTTFNKLLITKGREKYLPEIITEWIAQYKKQKGIKTVFLTTATPLTSELKKQFINTIQQNKGYTNIEIEEKVDERIIGGYVLEVGDQLVDASVAHDLKVVARQFENNDFIFKIR